MTWRAAQAKAQFSEVLDRAESEGPQVVTRRKHNFVVLSEGEYQRLQGGIVKPAPGRSLWDVLRPPPEAWTDEPIFQRARGKARPVNFD